jgi:SAM-dependent methyltransferase
MEMGAGSVGGDYFYQDIWAARKIYERRPREHIDVGSRIDGFITHLLVFMENVTVMDVRPMKENVPGLRFVEADCTTLDMLENGSVNSLSSLHAAEHFGLGRYGDPVDPAACFTFMENLARVLKPGGRLYFSVPIGRERVVFNGKRVFDPHTIIESFSSLELVGFSGYSASQGLRENAQIEDWKKHDLNCGFFEFGKSKP